MKTIQYHASVHPNFIIDIVMNMGHKQFSLVVSCMILYELIFCAILLNIYLFGIKRKKKVPICIMKAYKMYVFYRYLFETVFSLEKYVQFILKKYFSMKVQFFQSLMRTTVLKLNSKHSLHTCYIWIKTVYSMCALNLVTTINIVSKGRFACVCKVVFMTKISNFTYLFSTSKRKTHKILVNKHKTIFHRAINMYFKTIEIPIYPRS